jgi:hypothetical protein
MNTVRWDIDQQLTSLVQVKSQVLISLPIIKINSLCISISDGHFKSSYLNKGLYINIFAPLIPSSQVLLSIPIQAGEIIVFFTSKLTGIIIQFLKISAK